MKNKIWALFSIENEYNQPDNNLEAWWNKKPTVNQIAKVIGIKEDIMVEKVLKGFEVRISFVDYRLREIEEGKIKEVK